MEKKNLQIYIYISSSYVFLTKHYSLCFAWYLLIKKYAYSMV